MQAQSIRQQTVTAITTQQSLGVIKTLLSASFGCIAYLRNLLPDENFGEARLTSGERGSMAYGSQQSSVNKDSRSVSGITVKTVTRGFSTEADKLLNYLELGIFDAIERQYLKSFIFAIYLDNEDPNNIVESYTYNLTYYTVPGTNITVPIMSLDDQLDKLSLNSRSRTKISDPVAQATFKGRAPTLGDVKQSVKALVKNLVLVTQTLEPLPKRRFATFKLLYTENTPHDYEPPYFRPGDPEKDRFVFTTHDQSEAPEKISVGTVVTPHHGIDVQIQSIARFLPNDENDDSQYFGIEKFAKKGFGVSQCSSDAEARARQLEAQHKDAESRKLAWSAEDPRWTDEDADGEDDPELVNDSGIVISGPLGLRQADGSIIPMEHQADDAMDTETDAQYFGKPDVAPSRIGQLRVARIVPEDLESTQQIDTTQSVLPANEVGDSAATAHFESHGDVSTIDTQMLKAALNESAMEWASSNEMLDMETQATNFPARDSISLGPQSATKNMPKAACSALSDANSTSENISCACEHEDSDDVVFCEACEKWFHTTCMGYESAEDSRLPAKYVCIPCRLQGDVKFDLIKDKYPDILAAFADLALFRRAIKLAEIHNPGSLKEFRILTKSSASLAEQLWNRLEWEGFIVLEVIETDKDGLLETRSRATRSGKRVKSAKHIQKYGFNTASKKTALYRDYFSPFSEAEKNMIGLGRKSRSKKAKPEKRKGVLSEIPTRVAPEGNPDSMEGAWDAQEEIESQTQDESQFNSTVMNAVDLKRRSGSSSQETARTSKKLKISVVEENVDIEE